MENSDSNIDVAAPEVKVGVEEEKATEPVAPPGDEGPTLVVTDASQTEVVPENDETPGSLVAQDAKKQYSRKVGKGPTTSAADDEWMALSMEVGLILMWSCPLILFYLVLLTEIQLFENSKR